MLHADYTEKFINLAWNTPKLSSKISESYLENSSYDIVKLYNNQVDSMNFALNSFSDFKRSINDYFTGKPEKQVLYYPIKYNNIMGYFQLSPRVGYDYISNEEFDYSFLHYGLDIKTNLNNKLFLTAQWWSGHFDGEPEDIETDSNLLDSWIKNWNDTNVIYLDNIRGKLDWRGTYGSLAIGRDTYEIGSNISGSIILSNETNDYGYFSGILDLGNITLSIMHANLIPDSTNYAMGEPYDQTRKYEEKYLVIHKLDWYPTSTLHLFAGESLIYGSRAPEASYLLPHFFQRITEHNLSDRDNVLIFCGSEIELSRHVTLYSNLMLDELKKSEIFGDWWGNKYALQAGSSVKTSFVLPTTTTFEFTAVRPWLYTHKTLVNKYSNEGRSLGYSEGSNLINYTIESNIHLIDWIELNLQGSYQRQGSLGDSFLMDYDNRPKDTAQWLEGDITDTYTGIVNLLVEPSRCHKINIGCRYEKVREGEDSVQLSFSYLTTY